MIKMQQTLRVSVRLMENNVFHFILLYFVQIWQAVMTTFSLLSLPASTSLCYLREATICIFLSQVINKVEVKVEGAREIYPPQ